MPNTRAALAALLVVPAYFAPSLAAASNHSIQVLWEASSGVTPDGLQLPFTLTDTADPEDPVLSGGTLTLSTSDNAEIMDYVQSGAEVTMPDHLVIEARLRYVSGSTSTNARQPSLIYFTTSPLIGNALMIGQDEIYLLVSNSVKDTSAFVDTDGAYHDYRIEVTAGVISVYHDDIQVLTGSSYSDASTNGTSPRVGFGLGSTLSQGVSEWQSFEHNAGPPVVTANWNDVFAIQAAGPTLHPAVLVGLQPLSGSAAASFPDSETILLTYSGLSPNELIQIDLASYGPPFYPPDPIRVFGNTIEVDMDENGTMFMLVIELSSTTGELLDPATVLGFNPQPEPPAGSIFAFNPQPEPPAIGDARSIFAPLTGGSGSPGGTQISLSLQILDDNDAALPLSLVSRSVPGVGWIGQLLIVATFSGSGVAALLRRKRPV
jgi:hypothetical protein